jgi:hypothetical protein
MITNVNPIPFQWLQFFTCYTHFGPTLGQGEGKGNIPTGTMGAAESYPGLILRPSTASIVAVLEHWVILSPSHSLCMLTNVNPIPF